MSLENIVANLELDVYNHDSGRPTIKAIALDDNTRYAAAMIRYKGEPYNVDQNATVELIVIRPDKVGVMTNGSPYELPYDDPSTEGIEAIYGVYAELDQTAIAVPGELLGQFRITSGGQLLRTQIFKINNGKALDAETSDWAGEYEGHNLDEMAAEIEDNTADIATIEIDVSQMMEDLSEISESSNNLFDGNVTNLAFSNGAVVSGESYTSYYWPVESGETYTLSRRNTTDFNRFRVGFTRALPADGVLVYKEDGTQFTPTSAGDSLTVQTVTVPTNHDDYAYAMVYLSNSGQTIDDSCKLMINKGSEALEWEAFFEKSAIDKMAREKLAEYDGNTGIIQRNGIAETTNKLQQLNRPTRTASRTLGAPPLCLLHFSDIHGDKKRLQNIIEFKEYYSDYIADIIHTGDMVKYYSTDGITFWDEVDGAEDILNVIGNHDTLVGSTWIGMTMAEAYTTYFSPYVSNWGVTGASGQTYYYKDYTDNKVRLIVLDIMHQSADQLSWFVSTLASARTANLHVIVAVHSRPHWQFTSHQTAWDDKPLVPSYTAGYSDTSASTYPENLSDDYADAVDDFMTAGGFFVCWIHGHTHHKMFAQLQTHPNQLDVSVENAGIPDFAWTYAKARIDGTKSEDCFNVIGIDTDSNVLRIMAVGATYDRFMRHADAISYNYNTHTILTEDYDDEADTSEIVFTSGAYIKTDGSTVDVNAPVANTSYRYAVVPCKEGDWVEINVDGAGAARGYAFVDSNGNKIYSTAANVVTRGTIRVPSNTAYLVLNCKASADYIPSYKGLLNKYAVESLKVKAEAETASSNNQKYTPKGELCRISLSESTQVVAFLHNATNRVSPVPDSFIFIKKGTRVYINDLTTTAQFFLLEKTLDGVLSAGQWGTEYIASKDVYAIPCLRYSDDSDIADSDALMNLLTIDFGYGKDDIPMWRNEWFVDGSHRGYMEEAPQSTLASFVRAKVHGYNTCECDLRKTSDGYFVVHHNTSMPSDSSYYIYLHTLAELRANANMGTYNGITQQILEFKDLLQLMKRLDMKLFVELKFASGNEGSKFTAQDIADLVGTVKDLGMQDRVIWMGSVDSTDHAYAQRFRDADSNCYLAIFDSVTTTDVQSYVISGKPERTIVYARTTYITDTVVQNFASIGVNVMAWAVTFSWLYPDWTEEQIKAEIRRCISCGIVGMVLDKWTISELVREEYVDYL